MKDKITKILIVIISLIILVYYFKYIDMTTKKSISDEHMFITTNSTSSDIKHFEEITSSLSQEPSTKVTTTNIKDEELENYIKRVVACEMPALYQKEALKAQAVASRTYALHQKQNGLANISKEEQCYLSDAEMKSKWESNKDKYYKLISDAVDATSMQVMKKNGRMFKSYYFSTSNGYTENSISVFGEGDLSSVESIWDKTSKGYEVTTNFSKDYLISKLGLFDNIAITKRNNTNHVEQVSIDSKNISGIEFRHLLGLRSTDFDIKVIDDNYAITTYGYGHGVGMSQYGANELAKQGKNYQEILKYYYGDIEITTS